MLSVTGTASQHVAPTRHVKAVTVITVTVIWRQLLPDWESEMNDLVDIPGTYVFGVYVYMFLVYVYIIMFQV